MEPLDSLYCKYELAGLKFWIKNRRDRLGDCVPSTKGVFTLQKFYLIMLMNSGMHAASVRGETSYALLIAEFKFTVVFNNNKPDRATTRPGCVSACIDHATYVWRDSWTN